jgi:hypothetical protein
LVDAKGAAGQPHQSISVFRGYPTCVVVELRAICGSATINPLTRLNTSGNREADFEFKSLIFLWNIHGRRHFRLRSGRHPRAVTVTKSLLSVGDRSHICISSLFV